MYRPDNWENPWDVNWEKLDGVTIEMPPIREIFEAGAGADAMLEGLKKNAVSVQRATELWQTSRGVIIFIPKEEGK